MTSASYHGGPSECTRHPAINQWIAKTLGASLKKKKKKNPAPGFSIQVFINNQPAASQIDAISRSIQPITMSNLVESDEERSTASNLTGIRPFIPSTRVSLLIESLVKSLVTAYEPDTERSRGAYEKTCKELFQMGLIDESWNMNELEGVRVQFQRALFGLLAPPVTSAASIPMQNTHGPQYQGEFDELENIGVGAFGSVFRVRHKLDGGEYAVKKIPVQYERLRSVKNYLSEAKNFARLNHPNIVEYKDSWLELATSEKVNNNGNNSTNSTVQTIQYTAGKPWATLFIQMALCPCTLDQWLSRSKDKFAKVSPQVALIPGKVLSTKVIKEMLIQILRGVEHIHSRGLVHHDIKPSNIFVSINPGSLLVQLGDFGLACTLPGTSHNFSRGTPMYAAPEQLAGICDLKSDIYSVGIVLFELLEGFGPSIERSSRIPQLIRRAQLSVSVPLDMDLNNLVEALIRYNPKERPDASVLLKTLEGAPEANQEN